MLSLSILCFCFYCKWRDLKFLLYIFKILFQFSYDKTELFKNIGSTSSNFLNSLVTIGFFWQNTLDFQYTVMIMSSTNNNFIFSFPICTLFLFLALLHWLGPLLQFEWKWMSLPSCSWNYFTIEYNVRCRLFVNVLYQVEEIYFCS